MITFSNSALLSRRGTYKLNTKELKELLSFFPSGSPALCITKHTFLWSSNPSHREETIRLNEVPVSPSCWIGLAKLSLFYGACLVQLEEKPICIPCQMIALFLALLCLAGAWNEVVWTANWEWGLLGICLDLFCLEGLLGMCATTFALRVPWLMEEQCKSWGHSKV